MKEYEGPVFKGKKRKINKDKKMTQSGDTFVSMSPSTYRPALYHSSSTSNQLINNRQIHSDRNIEAAHLQNSSYGKAFHQTNSSQENLVNVSKDKRHVTESPSNQKTETSHLHQRESSNYKKGTKMSVESKITTKDIPFLKHHQARKIEDFEHYYSPKEAGQFHSGDMQENQEQAYHISYGDNEFKKSSSQSICKITGDKSVESRQTYKVPFEQRKQNNERFNDNENNYSYHSIASDEPNQRDTLGFNNEKLLTKTENKEHTYINKKHYFPYRQVARRLRKSKESYFVFERRSHHHYGDI